MDSSKPVLSAAAALEEAHLRVRQFAADETQTVLSLAGLGLAHFPALCFEQLRASGAGTRLLRLDLADNALQDLPDILVHACPNLKILFCLRNNFQTLPISLQKADSLCMLSFKSCRLEGQLNAHALPPNLVWLILTDNRITDLSPDFGQRIRNVRKLMLANNSLTDLPANLMDAGLADALELIRLSNNRLRNVPECLFRARKLAWIGLGGNPCTATSVHALSDLDPRARIDLHQYVLEDAPRLGSGASGDVYRAAKRGDPPGQFLHAVKIYRSMFSSDGNALDEIKAALALRSVKGLIPVHGYFGGPADKNDPRDRFGVIMQALHGMQALGGTPSFDSVTRDVYPTTPRFDSIGPALRVGLQVARTAQQIHKHGYAHGDLYAHNILVSTGSDGECFLSDLGAAHPYVDPRFELVEIRAFGCLLEELVAVSDQIPNERSLRENALNLSERCMGDMSRRPRFYEVVHCLEDTYLNYENLKRT